MKILATVLVAVFSATAVVHAQSWGGGFCRPRCQQVWLYHPQQPVILPENIVFGEYDGLKVGDFYAGELDLRECHNDRRSISGVIRTGIICADTTIPCSENVFKSFKAGGNGKYKILYRVHCVQTVELGRIKILSIAGVTQVPAVTVEEVVPQRTKSFVEEIPMPPPVKNGRRYVAKKKQE